MRENEYRQLADSVRRRGREEQNALLRAQWKILAEDQSKNAGQSKKFDDTGTYYDPIPWDRRRDN